MNKPGLDRLTRTGRIMYLLRVNRFYRDGGGFGYVFVWWNPLTYLVLAALFPLCALCEDSFLDVCRFRVGGRFRDHPEELEWL